MIYACRAAAAKKLVVFASYLHRRWAGCEPPMLRDSFRILIAAGATIRAIRLGEHLLPERLQVVEEGIRAVLSRFDGEIKFAAEQIEEEKKK